MSSKENDLQGKVKTILIFILSITVIALLLIIFFREPQTKIVYKTTPANSNKKDSSKTEVPPYVKNEVRNTISKKWKEMNACYLEFLNSTPAPEVTDGIISVDWQVSPDGKAISPEVVTSQIRHTGLEQCLISRIKTWQFPPPPLTGKNAYVLYKFNFKKSE